MGDVTATPPTSSNTVNEEQTSWTPVFEKKNNIYIFIEGEEVDGDRSH